MWFDKCLGLEFNGNNGGIEVLTSHYLCHIFNDFHVKEKQILLLFPKYMVAIVHTFDDSFSQMCPTDFHYSIHTILEQVKLLIGALCLWKRKSVSVG